MKIKFWHTIGYMLTTMAFSLSCGDDGLTLLSPENETELNEFIKLEIEQKGIPSIAAAIVKDDRIVWQNTYGYENIATRTAPTENTIYLLASISKTFTAVAVMQLYERGQLDLDEDINTYLPFEIRNPYFPDA